MEGHEIYEKVLPHVVRIDSETGFGTGFLFAYNKNKEIAAIATAAHVIQDVHDWLKPVRITHYQSKTNILYTTERRAIWIDPKNRDTATIIVNANTLPLPSTPLPLIKKDFHIKIGVEVAWAGFPTIASSNFCYFSGPISYFLEDDSAYLIDGVAINGVSGGPVFRNTLQGPELIGIVSAYRANRRATDTLPGLLVAQDVSPVYDSIQKMNHLDDAKEAEEKQKQEQKQQEMKPDSDQNKEKKRGHLTIHSSGLSLRLVLGSQSSDAGYPLELTPAKAGRV